MSVTRRLVEPDEDFDALTPREIMSALSESVHGQEAARRMVSTAASFHYARAAQAALSGLSGRFVHRTKSNILLVGETGTGKTHLIESLADVIDTPVVHCDATTLTEAGYVGEDVETMVRQLYEVSGQNVVRAGRGIIHIDEVDKIASRASGDGLDVGGMGVQFALLRLLEGRDVSMGVRFTKDHDNDDIVNTSGILFILTGAFSGLEEIAMERLVGRKGLGFGSTGSKKKPFSGGFHIDDFVAYGMDRQLMGRLTNRARLERLTEEDLYGILCLPSSPVIGEKISDLALFGIDLHFTEDGLREIAARAYETGSGGRALKEIVDAVLLPFQFDLPGTGYRNVTIDQGVVIDPQAALDALLAEGPGFQEDPPMGAHASRRIVHKGSYRIRLTELGASRRYVAELAAYGLGLGLTPEEAYAQSVCLLTEVLEYEQGFEERHGKPIAFTEAAMHSLLRDVLLRPERFTVAKAAEARVGGYLSAPRVLRKMHPERPLSVTREALDDGMAFAHAVYRSQ